MELWATESFVRDVSVGRFGMVPMLLCESTVYDNLVNNKTHGCCSLFTESLPSVFKLVKDAKLSIVFILL